MEEDRETRSKKRMEEEDRFKDGDNDNEQLKHRNVLSWSQEDRLRRGRCRREEEALRKLLVLSFGLQVCETPEQTFSGLYSHKTIKKKKTLLKAY